MKNGKNLTERVTQAAEEALADQQYVSAVDVLQGVRWLYPGHVERWRQAGLRPLEADAPVPPDRLLEALEIFRRWATQRGLVPHEIEYVARTPDRRRLHYTESGTPGLEREYRTHWFSPALSDADRERLVEQLSAPPELVVISPVKDWHCTSCSSGEGFLVMQDDGPLCLDCAGLGDLVYLPRGDAALTRRAHKASRTSAVVVRFSRTRKRYERQGVLVGEAALAQAERELGRPPSERW